MTDLAAVNVDGAIETEMFRALCSAYDTCSMKKNCTAEADYLAVCYQCSGTHPVCGECRDALPEMFGTTVIFSSDTCKHINLRELVSFVPVR